MTAGPRARGSACRGGFAVLLATLAATSATAAQPKRTRPADVVDGATVLELDGLWLFHTGDSPAFAQPGLDDIDWEQRQVPTAYAPWTSRWHGHGWYRLHLHVEEHALDDGFMLSLSRAREAVEVYFNGALVGSRGLFGSRPAGGARSTPLTALVPPALVKRGDNLIAVRIYDPTWSGGLPAGPILFGPPSLVSERTQRARLGSGLFLMLATLALVTGFSHVVFSRGRSASREAWWLASAGVGVAVALVGGTGVLEVLSPALDLTVRLPLLGATLAAFGMAGFFATRYDDTASQRVHLGTIMFLLLLATLLLAPDAAVFRAGFPAVLLISIVAALYAANLLANAARRQEPLAVPVFTAVVGFALILVYDGLTANEISTLPSTSLVGALGVLVVSSLTGVRQNLIEQEHALVRAQSLEHLLDAEPRVGILDATAMSVSDRPAFFEAVVREATRELSVQRCSLMISRGGELALAASVGLPKHMTGKPVPLEGSIAGWVYAHARAVTDRRLPEELASLPRAGEYATRSFISQPLTDTAGRCIGVLNVSDRFDAGEFTADDERAVGEVARKLGIVLQRLVAA